MARKHRMTYPGMYHIVNRGVERRKVFLQAEDYDTFLSLLKEMLENFNITLHCYCLMTNHYHILLETYEENISEAIKYLNSNYSIYFNKKYKRAGHLWQGRFLSYYLYDDAHFWIVTKYIERNPIKANMVKDIGSYKYQSFYFWKNTADRSLLENSMIFTMTLKEYESYISSDLHKNALDLVYQTPKIIVRDGKTEVLTRRVETFFEEDRDVNRNENIEKAYDYGYTKTEIAAFVGLSSKSVSNILIN